MNVEDGGTYIGQTKKGSFQNHSSVKHQKMDVRKGVVTLELLRLD